ncbi:MAG: excinuclease ABC subunit UvrB [Opitutae bacterium]|jgi:excinuclease ABC subunit B|nr:excinuclease ABC subunit UvrB [Opitutae bacterium]MBT5715430.1 excinuclease ABC subunit UvrB [Opitutae bacterium]
MDFRLKSDYQPMGDQPQAINGLLQSISDGNSNQTLLGVTGSGKTFSMANIIQTLQRPSLIISHNKTLAAQLYSEFKSFFPENAIEYFVSYYDYYQPEAYVPSTDTFIEKDSSINEEIERLRLAATSSLISRDDVIVIASVSCIYGLGSPDDFRALSHQIKKGEEFGRDKLLEKMVESLYTRNDVELKAGRFRVRGDVVDLFPAYANNPIRIEFWGDEVEDIREIHPISGATIRNLDSYMVYPANQYVTTKDKLEVGCKAIERELEEQVKYFEDKDLLLEAQRIRMRTEYDLEMLREIGFCNGIENYSRHLSGRKPGQRPWCLIDFFPEDALLFIDESHATLPQIGGMFRGDFSRKQKLVDFGFRLPSALDNRPLKPEEFEQLSGQTIYVSATPADLELGKSSVVVEQLIRPTGLLDPEMEIRPIKGQVEDCIGEIKKAVKNGNRILVTTLTKRMTEDLADFLRDHQIKVEYLHSDIDAIERVEILRSLRAGTFDVLVGVNLLREGLDLPEVALVIVLDADKEGFLRSETSLIQTSGRAARHEKGKVIFYADVMTKSLTRTLQVCQYRREKQAAYNLEHGITPKGVVRPIQESLRSEREESDNSLLVSENMSQKEMRKILKELEKEMLTAVKKLEFEKAALIRDQISFIKDGGKNIKSAQVGGYSGKQKYGKRKKYGKTKS